ncbi:hypothetical protein HPB50_011939 [Hyalomma asiaticum]|uniref:Uncharacterized protein n=1 Tax=Hyalomma asiaticum TaxID=266040 RepID=A0ACB7RHR2_HYAAI|nr:hypothetical protein HPB50_011939 [Hyalomma asiaticum]
MRNEMPTAEKLRNDVISDTDMDMPTISTRTMQRMLNDLGFLFRKRKGIPHCSNETTSLLGVESTSVQSEKCGGSSGGGPAPSTMAPLQQLVGSIAADMVKRVENPFDSDGTEFQLPVESLPVVRLLQPMVDGQNELDYDCPDDQWDVVSLVEQPQPPATPPPPTPNEDMPSNGQPNADPNTAAAGPTKSPNVSGVAASCTFAAATATRDACRPQRGRMALFGKDSERSKMTSV